MNLTPPVVVDRAGLDAVIEALRKRGFSVIGPTVRDQAIVYDEIDSTGDLPVGWTDEQEAGRYRLKRRDDEALFGYVVGPQSWKKYLHPARVKLVDADRDELGAIRYRDGDTEELQPLAFLGVRACELKAIAIQDRVFLGSSCSDSHYERRRRGTFTIAVNCGMAGGTCFCVSMKTGPAVEPEMAHDLALTEILDEDGHRFVISAGSTAGAELLGELAARPAEPAEIETAAAIVGRTALQMGRKLNTENLPALLLENLEHPRWEQVADRCLTCANCTLVCPTCFCTTVEDVTDITGDHAERWRRWDSCFTMDFSYVHGGAVRQSAKSRYRQWLTHKLSTWHEQFGSSGCVGCGRCITWCPVGIDLTEEAAILRDPNVELAGAPAKPEPSRAPAP